MPIELFVALLVFVCMVVTWFVTRASVRLQYEKRLQASYADTARLEGKIEALEVAENKLTESFQSISSETLSKNSGEFLKLAEEQFAKHHERAKNELQQKQSNFQQLIDPIKKSLSEVDQKLFDIEKKRVGAYEGLVTQVRSLLESQHKLQIETSQLGKALRSSNMRGQWGELQLRRVVEVSGMIDRCDFTEQESVDSENGKLRPDMVVQLPGSRKIVVDSKVPLSSYLKAFETDDEEKRAQLLSDHAKKLKDHVKQLSAKSYWESFDDTPEFVVMFIPNERIYSESLKSLPEIFEKSFEQKVIISTPTTLIAMLKSIAYAWKQEAMAENAKEVSELGKMVYKRLADFSVHLSDIGKGLGGALSSYNKAISSFESRLVVSARKFERLELDQSQKKVQDVSQIDEQAKSLKTDLTN